MKKSQKKTDNTVTANIALQRLIEGNDRFSKNTINLSTLAHQERREKLQGSQSPFAIILSCSDSRVPAEFIFDQGLGDLFVIRVAGNIVAPSVIGSIEFAAATFGTQLVVVMGHSQCGAISAALDVEQLGHGVPSDNIRDIVDRITPSIRPLLGSGHPGPSSENREQLLERCVRANVLSSVHHLEHGSKIIENLVRENKLRILGAEYSLASGRVEFLNARGKTSPLHHKHKLVDQNSIDFSGESSHEKLQH